MRWNRTLKNDQGMSLQRAKSTSSLSPRVRAPPTTCNSSNVKNKQMRRQVDNQQKGLHTSFMASSKGSMSETSCTSCHITACGRTWTFNWPSSLYLPTMIWCMWVGTMLQRPSPPCPQGHPKALGSDWGKPLYLIIPLKFFRTSYSLCLPPHSCSFQYPYFMLVCCIRMEAPRLYLKVHELELDVTFSWTDKNL